MGCSFLESKGDSPFLGLGSRKAIESLGQVTRKAWAQESGAADLMGGGEAKIKHQEAPGPVGDGGCKRERRQVPDL